MEPENEIQHQIYDTMQLKDTDELLKIWQVNDRSAWTDDAFLAIKQILTDRLGSVPAQEAQAVAAEEKEVKDEVRDRLLWISSLAGVLSYVVIVLVAIGIVISILATIATSASLVLVNVIVIGSAILTGGFYFVVLQLISQGILVLLDIRDNTARLVKDKKSTK